MAKIINTPALKVMVRNKFLGLDNSNMTEGYLVAVTSIPSRPLFFTVHLESGALWQRLPIEAICCYRYTNKVDELSTPFFSTQICQPFSCLEGDIEVIQFNHLAHYEVKCRLNNSEYKANYLFTVDVIGPGLSEDPVQHKAHHICALQSNGQLVALPNNHLLFIDNYFTETNDYPKYKRSDIFYMAGG